MSDSLKQPQNKVAGFVSYLSTVWENRNRFIELSEDISEEEQQERKIQKQRFFDFTIDGKVSARNYVGVVQYEDIRVEVYPKIFAHDKTGDSKKWQMNLFYWLTYCRKIKFPFSFADVSNLIFDDFLELLIYVFSNYTEEIISRQPFQAYQSVDEETTFLKGRLSFDNYTKHNLTTGKWQNFFCTHEPFVYDNRFNQIIKYVTRRLSAISENYRNKEKLNEILFLLHDVSDIRCSAEDCEKVKLNPLYEDHKHILALCKLYLSNQVIDMDSDNSRNFCFLVPMEYVFEDFVFGFIAEKWPTLNFKSQSSDYLALNYGKPVFRIRNDIYIDNKIIIDTKYKYRSTNDGLKSGVSQNDLYQMVSYAIRRNCKNVLLLYPQIETALNASAWFEIPSAMLSESIDIRVQNLDITFDDIQLADALIKARVEHIDPIFKPD
ncbi:McrC family protein [Mucilaginibacter sp.]|uniref:McrC family protein n=1 Tax=Mucilaginibacter sp. TaxID=1882438 RepID=UPI003D11146C